MPVNQGQPLTPSVRHGRFRAKFFVWMVISLSLVAGFTAIDAGRQFNDAKFRHSLQHQGVRVPAQAFSHLSDYWKALSKCSRGVRVLVRYQTNDHKTYSECVADTLGAPPSFYYLALSEPPPESRVEIAYDPKNPSAFAITDQGGNIPQRDVSRVWREWGWENLACLPAVAIFSASMAWAFARHHRAYAKT